MRIVRVTRSARKHGIAAEDIGQVLAAPLRTVVQGGERGTVELHIGLTSERDLLEVVVAPGNPVIVLHAMRLSPSNYRYLTDSSRTSEP